MVQKNTPRTHASTANDGDMEHMEGGGQDHLLYLYIIRERRLMAMSKIERANTELCVILHKLPGFKVGDWECIYVWPSHIAEYGSTG